MKQEHELPSNPITPMLAALIDKASGAGTAETIWQLMQEFARQAIALDLQQRGEPSGHAYRYSHHDGGTVIRFSNGGEVNGSRPVESVPYWFAPQPADPNRRKLLEGLAEADGCFRAAYIEGLTEALSETTDARLKDLIERRILYAHYAIVEAISQPAEPVVKDDEYAKA